MFNREDQLCSRCVKGYGLPVYSYTFTCVQCNATCFKYNLLSYIAVAFVPLTVFYGIVIVFKVRATSAPMMAFVLTCQLLSAPYMSRYLLLSFHKPTLSVKTLIAFYSIWNLDVFRSLYAPFCIHPNMTTLQVLTLDYLVGIYPLCLIVLTYLVA